MDSFSTSNLVEVLDIFKKVGIETIILDMRNNVGGSINDMKAFLRLVLRAREDPCFTILKSQRRTDDYIVKNDGAHSNFKWVVIVNNKLASATEVIAGVLKRQGAVIMVEPTYGKGTVQERWILFDVGDKRCPGLLKLNAKQIFFDEGFFTLLSVAQKPVRPVAITLEIFPNMRSRPVHSVLLRISFLVGYRAPSKPVPSVSKGRH